MKKRRKAKYGMMVASVLFMCGFCVPDILASLREQKETLQQVESETTAVAELPSEERSQTELASQTSVVPEVVEVEETGLTEIEDGSVAAASETQIHNVEISLDENVSCFFVLNEKQSEHYILETLGTSVEASMEGKAPFDESFGAEYCYYYEDGSAAEIAGILHAISDYSSLKSVYVEIEPALIMDNQIGWITDYIDNHSDVQVTFCLPIHSLEYWKYQSMSGCLNTKMDSYYSFSRSVLCNTNCRLIFPEQSLWLVASSQNYIRENDKTDLKSMASSNYNDIIAKEAGQAVYAGEYFVKKEECSTIYNEFEQELVNEMILGYADLHGKNVAIFGDNVNVPVSDGFNISDYISSVTGGTVYNYSLDGATIGKNPEFETESLCLMEMTQAVIEHDFSAIPEDAPNYESYVNTPEDVKFDKIILECGLQDYFVNYPTGNQDDKFDTTTVSGSYRTVIKNLKEAYPRAQIYIVLPTHTTRFAEGTTNIRGYGKLDAYVETIEKIAAETGSVIIDCYYSEGWDLETINSFEFEDGHPNENGLFQIASFYLRRF